MMSTYTLHPSWKAALHDTLLSEALNQLRRFLKSELSAGKLIHPDKTLWFNALNTTPLDEVKVVILGQDPYPTPGHAHGLCFSVLPEVQPLPKSLINIYKELHSDLGILNKNGYLQPWAEQGVLLLNSALTVQSGQANSHQGQGWEVLTDKIITVVNDHCEHVVFILWGAFAQKKGAHIDTNKHTVLKAPHPSPLSAHRGFFGSQPFSQTNIALLSHNQTPINWQL